MAKKKKAWNNTNPLYRYLHGQKKKAKSTKARGAIHMARHKRRSHRSSGLGGGRMMSGMMKPKGIILGALLGVGAALLVDKFLPNVNIPYKQEAAGFLVGGIPGAGAVLLLKGVGGTANSGNNSFY